MCKSKLVNCVIFLSAIIVVRATKYTAIDTSSFENDILNVKCAERDTNNILNIIHDNCNNYRWNSDFKLEKVKFTDCIFWYIRSDWFEKCEWLTSFNVNDVMLEKIEVEVFEKARRLTEFIASNNLLKEIPPRVFDNSKELTTVDLSNNTITLIDPLAFGNTVKNLNLSFNPLGDLPIETFAYLTKLEQLDLRRTNITTIRLGTFSHQHQLILLDLSENQLKKLNFNLFLPSLHNLHYLYLNQNQLRDLAGFRNAIFPKLHLLDIKNNQFNCSFLIDFINSLDWKVLRLRVDPQSIDIYKVNIRGINCEGDLTESNYMSEVELLSKIYEGLQSLSNEIAWTTKHISIQSFISLFPLILMCAILLIFLAVLVTKRNQLFKTAGKRPESPRNQTAKYVNVGARLSRN